MECICEWPESRQFGMVVKTCSSVEFMVHEAFLLINVFQNYCNSAVWVHQAIFYWYKLTIYYDWLTIAINLITLEQRSIWILNWSYLEDLVPNLLRIVFSLQNFVLAVSNPHGLLYLEFGLLADAFYYLVQ